MTSPIIFQYPHDRQKAAENIQGLTPKTRSKHDAFYARARGEFKDPVMEEQFPLEACSEHLRRCLCNQFRDASSKGLRNGDLLRVPESHVRGISRLGGQHFSELRGILAQRELQFDDDEVTAYPQLVTDEVKIPSRLKIRSKSFEVDGMTLPPGCLFLLPDGKAAERFAQTTAALIAIPGNPRDADSADAIKRLSPQGEGAAKTYPVYLSDVALEVLSQPEMVAQLHAKLGAEPGKSTTMGQGPR